MGNKPSYVWRSLLEGRKLLSKGLFWRIGNRKSIKIWEDKWINKPFSFKIQYHVCRLNSETKMAELILDDCHSWNTPLIQDIFSQEDAKLIASIPLSPYTREDHLVWFPTKNGHFGVKSAYHLQCELSNSSKGETSIVRCQQQIWKSIWKLGDTNGVKTFICRACKYILLIF